MKITDSTSLFNNISNISYMMISTEKSLLRHLYKTDDSVKNAVIFSLSYHVRKKIDE